MIEWTQIQIHPRPTVKEIDVVVKKILAMESSSEKDKILSQAWYLALPQKYRWKMWQDREHRQYFFETQMKFLGWLSEDFAILHIAATGETPIIY